jgi:NADH-quinone oxidoreductase subunit J
MDRILYVVFAAVATASALLAVTRKNAVAAACWLVVMFFGLAGVFILMEAYLVAALQILIYAGAIMVLFLFVIMLLDLRSAELRAHRGPKLPIAGVLLSAGFLGCVLWTLSSAAAGTETPDRVSATLSLAAPAGEGVEPAPAPPAREVALVGAPDVVPASARGAAGGAGWRGTFPAGGRDHDLHVWVAPGSLPAATLDGAALSVPWSATPERGAGTDSATVPLPASAGVPAGSTLDLLVVRGGLAAHPSGGPDGSPGAIGKALFTEWVLPFEVTSLLLTSAIFGAVVLTKRRLG